jgi:glucosylglycerate phosphorylase
VMDSSKRETLAYLADQIYPEDGSSFLAELQDLLAQWEPRLPRASRPAPVSEGDILLITYGDQFRSPSVTPLEALESFAGQHLKDTFSWIHILPFFPSTSDDGFAVADYRSVDPAMGTWEPVQRMARSFRMAYDLVLNHTSVSHEWFQGFLQGDGRYREFYLHRPSEYDSSSVVRPRTHPLLTRFTLADGTERHVWTTFSTDQVDLNYSNPAVMLAMIDTLLFYAAQGAAMIRLDAIAYLWKEDGTRCIHHRNTHMAVRLFRAVVETLGLNTVILTETNVPHDENVSYFGNGRDEAHMVYNFALPPLTLQAFVAGTAEHLRRWAATLPERSEHTTFLNFLASHDGIGVTPAAGWISDGEMEELLEAVQRRGGRVSRKATPDGDIPYELNINWFSAIADPDYPRELQVRAFLSSHAIMMALAGVPGVYVHSLIGSENWEDGVDRDGYNRAINREKLSLDDLERELTDRKSRRHPIFNGMRLLIGTRRREKCFSPLATQRVVPACAEVFALRRDMGTRTVLCLTNTAPRAVTCRPGGITLMPQMRDLLTGVTVSLERGSAVALKPWETLWLEVSS